MKHSLKNIITEESQMVDRDTITRDFVDFCQEELGYSVPATCEVVDNRQDLVTLASYNLKDNSVKVYGKDRALADILRSVAHELVHHKQLEDGKIDRDNPPQDIGGDIEDEANAVAGQLVKKFGYDNKIIYENEDRTFCEDATEGEYFCLAGSENLGISDMFKDDGYNLIHGFAQKFHLSDVTPEEEETYHKEGSKKVKKTVLKPALHKGPFNIPVNLSEIKSLEVAKKMIEKQIHFLLESDKMSEEQQLLREAPNTRLKRVDNTITEVDARIMRQIVREYSPEHIQEMINQHPNELEVSSIMKLFGLTGGDVENLGKQYIQFIWDERIPTDFEDYIGQSLPPIIEYEISRTFMESERVLKVSTINIEDTNFSSAICDAEVNWWEYDPETDHVEIIDSDYLGDEEWDEVSVNGKLMWSESRGGQHNDETYNPNKRECE